MRSWFRRAKPEEPTEPARLHITASQYDAIMDISSIIETGKPKARKPYDTVTILADGAGISYGAHQFTRQLLCDVLSEYYKRGGKLKIGDSFVLLHEAHTIVNRSVRMTAKPVSGEIRALMDALEAAGRDLIMQEAQRHVARSGIWDPAVQVCEQLGLKYALSVLSIFDLCTQSHVTVDLNDPESRLYKLRQTFPEYPPNDKRTNGERAWVVALNKARDEWLRTHPRPDLPATSYRTWGLLDLCARGCSSERELWQLKTPFTFRIRRYESGRIESYTIGGSPGPGADARLT